MSFKKIRARFDDEYSSKDFGVSSNIPSRTQQHFGEQMKIDWILKKYQQTGILGDGVSRTPLWGDFSELPSYQDALNLVDSVEARFAVLPAAVRDRFRNSPAMLLDFLSDDKNRNEAVELGLISKSDLVESVSVEVPVVPGEKKEGV